MSLFGNDDQYTDEQRKALAKSAEIKAARGDGATGVTPAGGIEHKTRDKLASMVAGGGSTAGSLARERLGDPMSDVGKKARDGLSGGSSITETKNGVTTSSGSSHTELGGGRSSATEYSSHSSNDGVNSSSGYSSTTATGGSGSFGTGATENVMKKKKFGIT